MSSSDAKRFVNTIAEDEELLDQLEDELEISSEGNLDAESLRERVEEVVPEFAREHGYDFTAEEGFEALLELQGEAASDELSTEELEQVAGGKNGQQTGAAVNSTLTVGLGCAILSIAAEASDIDSCQEQMGLD